jgi:hypothetical protein
VSCCVVWGRGGGRAGKNTSRGVRRHAPRESA